ncbi:MAG: class I SAM-dependent methyltransferase [Candidatus Omnitrophica bacterium]|nr:class I SAM-dependent methyltransferase [Candidatus Omnitrophota bacterium]MDD5436729.1 class I SAM-dependent methyltransferase [Candidatus Omnitrophota bacterium]
MNKTYANYDVLDFYKSLPFNTRSSLSEEITAVRKRRPEQLYPGLQELLGPDISVLEVGCGTGWLSNSISFLYNSSVLGIDFNPVAIKIAQEVADAMKIKTQFRVEDLFLYEPGKLFDLVISFGVLHHTDDCKFAVKRLFEKFVRPGGHVIIGLYHKYGRQPFLDHFSEMKNRGVPEKEMLARFRALQSNIKDETQLVSWFRDQVLHPHETQHTLEEMLPILKEANMELVSTSINQFKPISSTEDLIGKEKEYSGIARKHLENNRYFPGFFVFLARKIA